MKLSYKKLWVMLVERDLKKTEFAKKAKISSASLAKLGKGANVTTVMALLSNSLPKDRFCGRKFFIQMMRSLVMSRRCILLVIQHYI